MAGETEREVVGMRLRGLTYREIEELTGFSRVKINKIWKGYKKIMGLPSRKRKAKGVSS